MTITNRYSRSTVRTTVAALVSYLLIAATCAPLTTASRPLLRPKTTSRIQQPVAQHRAGELLVRFRAGVPRRDKEMIIAAHGAREKKELQGESGITKVELPVGSDARTVAMQMLLNPQVEFAEPLSDREGRSDSQ